MQARPCRGGASAHPLGVWRKLAGTGLAGEAARAAPLALQVCWHGREVTLAVHGEVDCATAGPLSEQLSQVAARRPARLVIDLAGVSFMDCAGISVIVRARAGLPAACPLVVRSPSPAVRRLLQITGLDQTCLVQERPLPERQTRPRCPGGPRLSHWRQP